MCIQMVNIAARTGPACSAKSKNPHELRLKEILCSLSIEKRLDFARSGNDAVMGGLRMLHRRVCGVALDVGR